MFTDDEKSILAHAIKIIESKYIDHPPMNSAHLVKQYLMAQLTPEKNEVFAVMYLNNQHIMISFEKTFKGTVNAANVHVRPIIARALELNAAAIIISHQHPSGQPEPSQADQAITNRISEACSIMDIRLLDHIVVGHGQCISFAERGLL
jgi:DNA repair protein RadC